MRVSSVVVEACDRRGSVQVQLPGHTVQVGQSQVNAAHRDHAGFKKVHVAVIITWDLSGKGRKRARLKGFHVSLVIHHLLNRIGQSFHGILQLC